jgi:hypothetical protein
MISAAVQALQGGADFVSGMQHTGLLCLAFQAICVFGMGMPVGKG